MEFDMTKLKSISVAVALLVGAGVAGSGQALAMPLANTKGGYEAANSNVEQVQMKKWKYDRQRHGTRKRDRDRDHRFFLGGFWYASPFWTFGLAPFDRDRLSCGEARRIVDRRFDRVRTIECRGRIYTFRAVNNRGRTVRISVNSLTGNFWRS
jgi:hypothetical protein